MATRCSLCPHHLSVLAWLATFFCLSYSAAAPSAGDAADAQYRSGTRSFAAGHYEKALTAFQASLELEPSPNTRFKIAQCQLLLKKVASAYLNFRRAADESAGRLKATREKRYELTHNAAVLEAAAIEAKVPRLTLAVPAQVPEGFRVLVDDAPLPRAAWGVAVETDPGLHRIVVEGPRLLRYESTVELAVGGQQRVELPVQRLATASLAILYQSKPTGLAAYIDNQPLPLEQLELRHELDVGQHRVRVSAPGYANFNWSASLADGEHRSVTVRLTPATGTPRWVFFTVAAAGVAAAAVGAGFGINAENASAAEQARPIMERESKPREAIREDVVAANVAFSAAGALGLTAVILGITTRWRAPSVLEKKTGATLHAMPVLGPKQVGFQVRTAF